MIFLCFSSKDRYDIVESIYYHIKNIGIPVWYDRNEILMGDNRDYKNFIEGVDSCKYAVIILSPNSIASVCANEEIDLIYKRYKAGESYVFPVFYNIAASEIPPKYHWMKKLVYKELNISIDSRGLCNHIICKYLLDQISQLKFKSLLESKKQSDPFLVSIIDSYLQIDGNNYNSRIALLYSAILYIKKKYHPPEYCIKGAQYLFNETKLNLPMDLRETIIFERLFIISSNYLFF